MGAPHCEQNIEIIPSYLERITWIANDVFGNIIAQCGDKYPKMTDLQRRWLYSNDSKDASALVRAAEALAHDLGAIDDGDEGVGVNLAGIAA